MEECNIEYVPCIIKHHTVEREDLTPEEQQQLDDFRAHLDELARRDREQREKMRRYPKFFRKALWLVLGE